MNRTQAICLHSFTSPERFIYGILGSAGCRRDYVGFSNTVITRNLATGIIHQSYLYKNINGSLDIRNPRPHISTTNELIAILI